MNPALDRLPVWFLYTFAGVIGAILGSFANVCIARLPAGLSVVSPGSACPKCGHRLGWSENIPVVSFLILKGRCKTCGEKISIRYPLVEIISILLAVSTWWHFQNPAKFIVYFCLLVVPLIIITFIDLKHMIIPDLISIPGIIVGFASNILLAGKGAYANAAIDSALGIFSGALFLFLVAFIYEKLKKQEGLGGGDIKLIAMLGAFFGWKAAIFILLVSSLLGSAVGAVFVIAFKKGLKYAIPFGPFLAAAGLVYMFFGGKLLRWYMGWF